MELVPTTNINTQVPVVTHGEPVRGPNDVTSPSTSLIPVNIANNNLNLAIPKRPSMFSLRMLPKQSINMPSSSNPKLGVQANYTNTVNQNALLHSAPSVRDDQNNIIVPRRALPSQSLIGRVQDVQPRNENTLARPRIDLPTTKQIENNLEASSSNQSITAPNNNVDDDITSNDSINTNTDSQSEMMEDIIYSNPLSIANTIQPVANNLPVKNNNYNPNLNTQTLNFNPERLNMLPFYSTQQPQQQPQRQQQQQQQQQLQQQQQPQQQQQQQQQRQQQQQQQQQRQQPQQNQQQQPQTQLQQIPYNYQSPQNQQQYQQLLQHQQTHQRPNQSSYPKQQLPIQQTQNSSQPRSPNFTSLPSDTPVQSPNYQNQLPGLGYQNRGMISNAPYSPNNELINFRNEQFMNTNLSMTPVIQAYQDIIKVYSDTLNNKAISSRLTCNEPDIYNPNQRQITASTTPPSMANNVIPTSEDNIGSTNNTINNNLRLICNEMGYQSSADKQSTAIGSPDSLIQTPAKSTTLQIDTLPKKSKNNDSITAQLACIQKDLLQLRMQINKSPSSSNVTTTTTTAKQFVPYGSDVTNKSSSVNNLPIRTSPIRPTLPLISDEDITTENNNLIVDCSKFPPSTMVNNNNEIVNFTSNINRNCNDIFPLSSNTTLSSLNFPGNNLVTPFNKSSSNSLRKKVYKGIKGGMYYIDDQGNKNYLTREEKAKLNKNQLPGYVMMGELPLDVELMKIQAIQEQKAIVGIPSFAKDTNYNVLY